MMNGPIDMSGERVNMPPTDGLQVIPEAAVEAAWSDDSANPRRAISRAEIWAILEAAAPHILEACWDAAAEAAIEREHTYGAAEKAKYDNPYRPTP